MTLYVRTVCTRKGGREMSYGVSSRQNPCTKGPLMLIGDNLTSSLTCTFNKTLELSLMR